MIDDEADTLSFGPFILDPRKRLLQKNGIDLPLGARTLDILIELTSRANLAIGKRELMAKIWPGIAIDEGGLRFHISRLRKVLGDGEAGARYIVTLPGRGYCFVAPTTRLDQHGAMPAPPSAAFPRANVPEPLARMVGRADRVRMLAKQLVALRFVTLVGVGGVGKTTVAVAVAHDLMQIFAGAVVFVDFGALSDPGLAAASLASLLGLPVHSDDPIHAVIAYLRDRRILLILDNCEHIIEAVAPLAARIVQDAPQVHILATSREALRVPGEHIHRLAPLAYPADDRHLTAAIALTYPAIQLFVERAAARGARLSLSDADAVIASRICRRLDGMALAIELAAGRVEVHGLQQIATLLDERFSLLWPGHRTAPQRQQTLKAMLDWSYDLLTLWERQVLRRLAAFVGKFTLGAVLAVLASASIDQAQILSALDSLVAKSMVAVDRVEATVRYRLLETTRAYTIAIKLPDAASAELAARHAIYYREWLVRTVADEPALSHLVDQTANLADLGNVRAALEWCFGRNGNTEIGVGLAVAAAPVFLAMSLLTECIHWSERAIHALGDAARGGREEMHLQTALGMSMMFARGESEAVRHALDRGLVIAERLDDAHTQLRLQSMLEMFCSRVGDRKSAMHHARRASAVSKAVAEPAALALGHCLLGMLLHRTGDLADARVELEAALHLGPGGERTSTIYFGFNGRILASAGLARILWLQGHPDQAVDRAHQTVKDAAGLDHPVTLSIALVWAIQVFLEAGSLSLAEEHIDWFVSHAQTHSLGPYRAVGGGFKGQLAIRRGDPQAGVASLEIALAELRATRYESRTAEFKMFFFQGLLTIGRTAEAMTLIDETTRRLTADGDFCYMPELLRVKGCVFRSVGPMAYGDAEACYMQSLAMSRQQGARAWELRTAIDLAALLAEQAEPGRALALLKPVYEKFEEGWDTADLRATERQLAGLVSQAC